MVGPGQTIFELFCCVLPEIKHLPFHEENVTLVKGIYPQALGTTLRLLIEKT
jgi:hypothetical protein